MDPATLAVVSIATTVIGGAVSAYGAVQTGQAQSKMYQYQAGVAAANEKIARQNADYERSLGEVQAQKVGLEERARQGSLRAAAGASGVGLDTGSPLEVQESSQALGQYKQDVVRSDSSRRAYGYEVEAMNKQADVGLYGMAATTARTSGELKAGGSLISSVGSVADKWYKYNDAFGTSSTA